MGRLRHALAVALATAALFVGSCAPAATTDRAVVSRSALETHIDRLRPPGGDALASARAARYAADRLREAGIQPVLHDSFLLIRSPSRTDASGARPAKTHVMGYIAGRHAGMTERLVLVSADLHSEGGAAVLEAARMIVGEAAVSLGPGSSVGIALWGVPGGAVAGARDFIERPLWSLEAITRVVHVTEDATTISALQGIWEARGIPVEVVHIAPVADVDAVTRTYRLALAAHRDVLAAAAPPTTSP